MKTICKLKDIMDILNEDGYFCLGHGTGRSKNNEEVVKSIFENGLRTKDNSLYYTSVGIDTSNIAKLETRLNNWEHCNSKKIIIIRLPIKYINIYGDQADLDGERYGAFMIKRNIDGKIINFVDPKFIVGCYDVERNEFEFNPQFEKELTEESIENLIKQYRETLEKTKTRLEKLEKATKALNEENSVNQNFDTNLLDSFDFDDEIELDTNPKR